MSNYELNFDDFYNSISNYRNLDETNYKYSYFMVKPNGNRDFQFYLNMISDYKLKVFGFYAIKNYNNIDLYLHPRDKEKQFLIPVDKMINDCCGNYAILIVVGKKDISYNDLVKMIYEIKKRSREKTSFNYFSYVFNFDKIVDRKKRNTLVILDEEKNEIKKSEMNGNGDYFVFSVNSLHAPDADVEITIEELKKLCDKEIFLNKNKIPICMIELILKYKTFEYLQDMN